ncbi:MAG: YidC/Oxa1 family membrane protein insertase [Chloroflexi bacterium]|nr:YidC/Oxa1 family membrane protein insertase [Chloroflexota bacterium]
MGNIFDLLFVNPMTNLLLLIYDVLFHNYVLAIIVLTIIIRLITLPLTLKQQVSSMKMAAMQPQIKAIQEKYKNEPQKLSEEMRKVGFNPLGGCLPLVIQFPILIGLYNAITRTLAVTPFSLLELGKYIYGFLPNLSSLVPVNNVFLGVLDLGQPDKLFVIPILVIATTYFSTKLTTPPSTDAQTKQTNQMMSMMMPVMFGFFMLSAPAGLGIYWIVSNLIGIGQYYLMKPRLDLAKAQHAAVAGTTGSTPTTPQAPPKPKMPPPRSKVKHSTSARVAKPGSEKK